MVRAYRVLSWVAVVATALAVTSCKKKGTAEVRCGAMQSFEGRIGTLNAPHFALGSIVALNTATKSGVFLGSVSSTATDRTESPTVASEEFKFEQGVTVNLSANIPQGVEASVKSEVVSQSVLEATNVKRVSLNDPAKLATDDQDIKSRIKHATQTPNIVVMLVSSITYTDELGIQLKNSVGTEAGASLLNYGKYKLEVSYHCSDVLNMNGVQFGGFFKYSILKYVADAEGEGSIQLDLERTVDLSGYDLNAAVVQH